VHAESQRRVESVDILRGVVMVLMALDHTRDFFGTADNPTDVAKASSALFATRWITHICAPTFFLLTGVGAGLMAAVRTRAEVSKFLVTRGAILVALELTVLRFIYQFNVDYKVTFLLVIWALGWAMIFLGVIVHLRAKAVLATGLALIVGHNLFDSVRATNPLLAILHGPGFAVRSESVTVFAAYPLIPWIGVTAVGFVLAGIYAWPVERRRKWLLNAGVWATFAFVALRYSNLYGDPSPWRLQDSMLRTIASFANTTKYPPSLLYLLMTLGPALLILRWAEGPWPAWTAKVANYGKAPLFYFAAHFFLIHLLAVIVCLIRYGDAHWMFESPNLGAYPFTRPPDWGYSLRLVYVIWIAVVASLYLPCRWMAGLKAAKRYRVLSYF
jgi:uncharacterized membrane protein